MTGIIKLRSEGEFEAIEISEHAGDRAVIARWLLDSGAIPADSWTVESAKELNHDLDILQREERWVLKDPQGRVAFVDLATINVDFSRIDENPLEEIAAQWSDDQAVVTETQWQWFGLDEKFFPMPTWLDGEDEESSRAQAKSFNEEAPKVRRRVVTTVLNPWAEQ